MHTRSQILVLIARFTHLSDNYSFNFSFFHSMNDAYIHLPCITGTFFSPFSKHILPEILLKVRTKLNLTIDSLWTFDPV